MRYSSFVGWVAALSVDVGVAASAHAHPTQLMYSFEPGEIVFTGTAGSAAATTTGPGVTHGATALSYNWNGTFVGARSAETTNAAVINGINAAPNFIRLDLTNLPAA